MNYEEEQQLEVEALQAIFVHEDELVIESPTRFVLNLLPYPDEEEENHANVKLAIEYPATYPEEKPIVEIKGQSTSLDKIIDQLQAEVIEPTLEENIGMPMIYMLAEAVQEWLRNHNEKELTMYEEMMLREREKQKAEGGDSDDEGGDDDEEEEKPEQEWKGLEFKNLCEEKDRLTADSFLKWREAFDQEMIRLGLKQVKKLASTVSGKEFFKGAKSGADMGDDINEEDVTMNEEDMERFNEDDDEEEE